MKKNFFKKLSFVMALAMIISVIAPAAGAFAATGLRLNATSKTLFLGESTKSFNFNPLGMSKGATQKWTSSKPSVATVNAKNGVVTAKATGTTTITATITNAKKTVTKKLTAKVTVGDNVKTLSVAAPAGADVTKLTVGTDYKFVTSYTTKGGSKKTTNTFAWSVDKEGATVSKTGVFNATVPGEYTVTVTANRYKNVKVADATIKVTVLNAVKEVKQVNTNTFTVEFAGKVDSDLTATSASVAQVVNGKDVTTGAEKIKSVTLDSTGKVATVVLYADFVAKSTYKFVYGTLEGTFVAASKDLKDVAEIVFDDFNVNINSGTGTNFLTYIYALNADGVRILNGSDLSSYLTFETADLSKGSVDSGNKLAYVYAAGNTMTVKATFTAYVYNETTKLYETITRTDSAVATGVTADIDNSTMQYAVNSNGSAPSSISSAWTSPIAMAVGDNVATVYVRYKQTTNPNSYIYTTSSSTTFTYVSSDPSKLSVNGNNLYPIAVGNVTVIVKNSDGTKVLGSFEVKINAERVLATATPDVPTVNVGNNPSAAETKVIKITALDNLGSKLATGRLTATRAYVSAPTGVTSTTAESYASVAVTGTGTVEATFNAATAAVGLYQYKITVADTSVSGVRTTRDVVVSMYVVDSTTNATPVNYVAVFEAAGDPIAKTTVDFSDLTANTAYNVVVYAVNSNGYRVYQVPAASYDTTISYAGAAVVTGSATTVSLPVTTTTNGALQLANTGVYAATVKVGVTALGTLNTAGYRAAGSVLASTTLNVSNSYTKSVAVKNYSVNGSVYTTVAQVLDQALDLNVTLGEDTKSVNFLSGSFTVNGINNTNIITDITGGSVLAGTNLYIDKVTAVIDVDGAGPDTAKIFTFDVKQSIAIK